MNALSNYGRTLLKKYYYLMWINNYMVLGVMGECHSLIHRSGGGILFSCFAPINFEIFSHHSSVVEIMRHPKKHLNSVSCVDFRQ